MVKVGVIGTGYWGKNHVRVFSDLNCELIGIADVDVSKRSLADKYGISFKKSYRQLLKDVDAVSIATPAAKLYPIARTCLNQGKHVLVEKPFVFKEKQAEELISLAKKRNLVLMVGHVFLYNPAVRKIKEYLESGNLGEIFYVYSQRLNLGIIRQDVNALWNFAPHDLSILFYFFNLFPKRVIACGGTFLQKNVEDVVFLVLEYPNGLLANIHLSWIDPLKVRRMTVVGSQKMLVYDDTDIDAPIKIFNKGVVLPERWTKTKDWNNFGEFKMKLKFGDTVIPYIEPQEPLRLEFQDFLTSIEEGRQPLSSGEEALKVIKVLRAAQKSLRKGGKPVEIKK
jgi:predicted dehydrogenase